jgi:hypothetical protein
MAKITDISELRTPLFLTDARPLKATFTLLTAVLIGNPFFRK